jgi:hypothetical protein
MELTFENWNFPLGIVRVTVERIDSAWSGVGEWDGQSLFLSAEDADGVPCLVFGGCSSTWTVNGTANDWDSAIPGWMQTNALSAAFDNLCAP